MADKSQTSVRYNTLALILVLILRNMTIVGAMTNKDLSKLESQLDEITQRIVSLEKKDMEQQQTIDRQQNTINNQVKIIEKIQRITGQQSLKVSKLQDTVKQQSQNILQQKIQYMVIKKQFDIIRLQYMAQPDLTILNESSNHEEENIRNNSDEAFLISNSRKNPFPTLFGKRDAGQSSIRIGVGSVAFTARLETATNHIGLNQIIPFDSVLLNLGNGYHSLHGIFIAPQSGIYLFSSTVTSDYNLAIRAALVQNGNIVAVMYAETGDRHDQGSQTVIIQVKQGDEIWVKNIDDTERAVWGGYFSTFSGYLIVPM